MFEVQFINIRLKRFGASLYWTIVSKCLRLMPRRLEIFFKKHANFYWGFSSYAQRWKHIIKTTWVESEINKKKIDLLQ